MTDLLLPATPIVERRVRTGDITLNVAFAGSEDAPTVVLLHGISSRLNTWHPVVDALAADYRLVIWEARGHGDSDHPAAGYLLENYAADLSALLAALEIERPAIVGHSLGGMIAMTWAVDHPATARAIVLEDAPLRGGAEHVGRLEEWRRIAAMTVDEAAAHYRAEDPAQSEEEVHRRARSITATAEAVFTELRDEAVQLGFIDRVTPLGPITSPILQIHGDMESGGLVYPEDIERFARVGPAFETARIAGGSHGLHRESTEEFLRLTRAFLARHL